MNEAEQTIFDYLTKFRNTINLAGLADEVGTSRAALTEFMKGKRGLSDTVKFNFLWHFHSQLRVIKDIPPLQ